MELRAQLEKQIRRELQEQRSFSTDTLLELIAVGREEEAADKLLFFCVPGDFISRLHALRDLVAMRFGDGRPEFQKACIAFLCHVTLGLSSHLARWNLQNADLNSGYFLTNQQLEVEVETNLQVLAEWEGQAQAVAAHLREEWRKEAEARFVAEKAQSPSSSAATLVGDSLCAYLTNVRKAIRESNLRRIAEMRAGGQCRTELGNDYAAFLRYTMYLGASFVTTNPVLVDIAWEADQERWAPVMRRLVAANPGVDGDGLARLATMEVVLENMRLLRPIFLLTSGKMGCVSLQVNPKKHGDATTMVTDATAIYAELRQRLAGGVPNVVFKLPGTFAGLQACRILTGQGIGVNITVNFGLFQQLRFAEVIAQGQAIFSTLTEMNGRLAFPVRDELLAKLETLAAQGITEADAREAAAWAGVAVIKKLHKLLERQGYDLERIKPLVASLRFYDVGAGYDRLPSPCPDISGTVGTGIITVFPNIRHVFDREQDIDLAPARIAEAVPPHVLSVLAHSEIFKQAYYVADRRWAPQEEAHFQPAKVLALEEEEAVAAWAPVQATLSEFARSYDRFVQRLLSHR